MKKYFGALAAAVLTALCASGAGETRYGDIRSIEAVPNASFGYPNQATPHKVGEDFYILVRLLNEDHRDSSANHEWQIKQSATGVALGDYQATVYWPGLSIAIGNEIVTASFVSEGPDGVFSGVNGEFPYYTDLYFKYTVKEGQLGLPVRLVNSKGEIIDAGFAGLGAYSLRFVNVNTQNGFTGKYWNLINDQATLAEFWFGPSTPNDEPAGYPSAPSGQQRMETSRIYPGIYVQTIDFEATYADESDPSAPIWREVYQGISDSVGKDPAIIGTADSEGEATTVYIWSEDESIVTIDGVVGETVSYVVEGNTVTRKVFPISLTPSGMSAFKLKGAATAAEDSQVNIVLCATKVPAINAAGQIVEGSTITRRVKVVAAPSPFITISDADGNRSVSLVATNNYTAGVRMKMTFSKSFDDGEVKVRLMMGVGTTDIDPVTEKYFFISDSDGADPESTVSLTEITMPKGETETYFYIYPLGTCKELKTIGVVITNSIDQATQPQAYEQFKDGNHRGMTIKLTDQKPVVTATMPSSGFKNDTVNVDLVVSDNWRDLSTNNTNGYKVAIYLGGTKVCETNGVVFAENEQISFPVTIPAEGNPLRGTVQVWDQMNNASASVEITIEAKAPLTVSAGTFSSTDVSAGIDTDPTYAEGQTVYLRAILSSASSAEMYAFIVPLDEASSNLISTTAITNGLKISTSGDYACYSDYARVKLLDGNVEGRKVNLGVVLKDCQNWNDPAGEVLSTYSFGGTWTLTVTNVAPYFASEGVWGGDDTNRIEVANGATYMGKVSATTPVQFSVKIADAGLIDSTNATTRVRWTWTDGPADEPYVQNMITTVDSNGIARATITFDEESSRQRVSLQIQDRDMIVEDPGVYAPQKYEFNVNVGYVPTVIIEYPNGNDVFSETGNSKFNYVTVKVSEWPTTSVDGRDRLSSSNPLQVRVSLPKDFHPNDNAVLHLKSNNVVQVDDDEGVIVTFKTARAATKDGVKVYFDLDSQNGGSGPNEDPSEYIIVGEVITETMASTEQTWSEYFAPVEQTIKILNEHPVLNVTVADTHEWSGYEGGTNEWTAGEKVKLEWVYTDIAPDVTNKNAAISWTVIDVNNKRSVKIHEVCTNFTFDTRSPCNATARGIYEFAVPSAEYTIVTVTARDGDGGEAQYSFVIHVIPTKNVIVTPVGPAETSTSKYSTAPGLGWGHIYVEGSTGQYTMRQFIQTWMYSETATKANLYAAGYPAAATNTFDDGNLGTTAGFSKAAEPNEFGGKYTNAGNRFNYKSDYDSFFYTWLFQGPDESAKTIQTPAPTTKSETAQPFNPLLDNEKEETSGYSSIEVEAIFSRELYASDNLGDINADDIPDVFVKLFPGFGIYGDDGSIQGNDLTKLGNFNGDGDYLPATEAAVWLNFIPGVSSDWMETGVAFSSRREIRGWDINLNDAATRVSIKGAKSERRYTNPIEDTTSTLSKLEYLGFITWCAQKGHDASKEDSWLLWSPENPTDPTLADSDDDGAPDGYEYYIWYRAHVGFFDYDGSYRRLTGRLYNPLSPAEPIEISCEEVVSIFNPNKANDLLAYADTDGDGIADLVEFELGSNPVDFDSDGDGLPDGFEVYVSETDPLVADLRASNPDADSMAMMEIEDMPVIGVLRGGKVERYTVLHPDLGGVFSISNEVIEAEWTYFSDGRDAYVTTNNVVTQQVDGVWYLMSQLDTKSTWKCKKVGKIYYLGLPAVPEAGFKVRQSVSVTSVSKLTLGKVPPRAYSVFKYDAAGTLVVGQEMHEEWTEIFLPEGTLIVEPMEKKTVVLLHHNVYIYNGLAKDNPDRTRKVWVPIKAFSPNTGWNVGGGENTAAFTTYDEFMYPHFLLRDTCYYGVEETLMSGGYAVSLEELTPTKAHGSQISIWERYCTDPNNADTDADGTPDGWEAYLFMGEPMYIEDEESPFYLERDYNKILLASMYNIDRVVSQGSPVTSSASAEGTSSWADEYAGSESTKAYGNCETIVNANRFPEWTNKMRPTDPWQDDTDGDGLSDMAEKDNFLYGEATASGAGGGLNPLSWDTDLDGLPDPWEVEFAGGFVADESIPASTNATAQSLGTWAGGMNGTVPDADLDYDFDGLQNWQEYLAGAMRCWRYDDTISSWDNNTFDPSAFTNLLFNASTTNEIWNNYWSDVLISDGQGGDYYDGQSTNYNPRIFVDGYYDCSASYFSYCANLWDPACGRWYMFKDGINHDLANPGEEWLFETPMGDPIQCNRFTWRPFLESGVLTTMDDCPMSLGDDKASGGYEFGSLKEGYVIYPKFYICCSPIKADTDNDGMDDYYELYHGMNPLLGASGVDKGDDIVGYDVIYAAYGGAETIRGGGASPVASADRNYWKTIKGPSKRLIKRQGLGTTADGLGERDYDFEIYPWLNGLATADPDGDDIRNQSEAIMANMQAQSSWLHTDPTPLWMTDSSYEKSLTRRYYMPTKIEEDSLGGEDGYMPDGFIYNGKEYKFNEFQGITWDPKSGKITFAAVDLNLGNVIDVAWAFEENEGYDTDHDFISDHDEAAGKTKSTSDPQNADSPLRRQAMWFPGENSLLQTTLEDSEIPPSDDLIGGTDLPFLYYTVECWAKPEGDLMRDQTLVERAVYTGEANLGDRQYLRKNFLIGIKNGRWYTMYDSAGTAYLNPQEILDGPVATTNWTHVAATYDGSYLSLYINGVKYKQIKTGVRPENGAAAVSVDPGGNLNGKLSWGNHASILVGASTVSYFGVAMDSLWRNLSLFGTGFVDYNRYYKGYIDEVRIWDGARSENEIRADYRKRYNRDDALANRQAVWEVWSTRIYNRAPSTENALPAELKRHWSFDHMPGAVETNDVIHCPAGFTTREDVIDAKAIWSRPIGWKNKWWMSVAVRSTIYNDPAWIPWISDTVGHLPRFDKTTGDSKYWSEDLIGGALAANYGYSQVVFPRTAEPWSRSRQVLMKTDPVYSIDERWNMVKQDETLAKAYSFTMRHRLVEGFDLLPLGGAYAKRISAAEGGMWDDGTAADAWAETGVDANFDRLPDWWAKLAFENYCDSSVTSVTWSTPVNYNGIVMPAWAAYLRDLARGMLPDGEYHAEFVDNRDLDHDGMPDWWEDMYKIDTGSKDDATADPDNDGLSNYKEYIISEVDRVVALDPTLARSVSEDYIDYFFQTTNTLGETVYLGEIYADHDFMEDFEEDFNGLDRTRYDANTDADEDGWAAWSEMRYSDYKMSIAQKFVSHLAGIEEEVDKPVPVVHATLRYNGKKVPVGSTAPIIIQAYSGNALQNEPTAVYSITPGEVKERYVYLGFYEDRVFHGTLTPGWVVNNLNSISLQVAHAQPDDVFSWTITDAEGNMTPYTGTYEEMWAAFSTYGTQCKVSKEAFAWADVVDSTWDGANILQTSAIDSTMKGHLLVRHKRAGTIDFVTGDFDLDLTSLSDYYMSGSLISLRQYFYRIKYESVIPTLQTKSLEISLAKPDKGSLTEGATAFVAFIDADGNGAYTPDTDPIGFVKDVEVGWDQVPSLVIEMTDSSQAAGQRFDYSSAPSNTTLRIIRTSVNGSEEGVKRRIVYSREMNDVKRTTVYEGDLVTSGKFGLDWSSLRSDLAAMKNVSAADVTKVGYTVVAGAGSIQNIDPASIVKTFTVNYTTTPVKPTLYSPSALAEPKVESARPKFVWSATDGYTAFRLQIWEQDGTNAVYNSPLMALPPMDASGRFFWTAPVYVGTNVCADAWVLNNNSSYKWRVAMYNAKFSNTNDTESAWSDFASFSTALAESNDFSTRLGTAKVSISYFGPATNELSSVIVQLFRNADFFGTPASQTRLYASDLTAPAKSLVKAAEVSFSGLDEDEYFAVAFIDRNGNGKRDSYETWGYSAQVGLGLSTIWRPLGAKVDPTSTEVPTVEVFLEDTDVNRDDILDWNQTESLLAVAASSTISGADSSDVDLDGLTGDEETGDTYTNKQKWDTDGDGMPDGWEARFADTDPLMADADTATSADYMAFVVTNGIYRLVADKDGNKYLVRDVAGFYRVGDVIAATNLVTTYDYTTIVPDETRTNLVTITYAGLGTNILAGADFKIDTIASVDVALVHAQVYDEFGYSQSTAIDPSDANTKAFTALDKYMLVRYFNAIGMKSASEAAMNVNKTWSQFTLRPQDSDCDRDGIADGWELYLMFGTNRTSSASNYTSPAATPVNPWKYADRDVDIDGDELTLVDEYAQGKNPSDPWNMYSIYNELFSLGVVPADAEKFTDSHARRFGITAEEYDKDWDFDLISNVQEMWAYYRDMDSLADIDPNNAWSDGVTPDYFRVASGSYLGAIYNGGEFIEPELRFEYDMGDMSMAGTRVYRTSGWDYWSVARYSVCDAADFAIVYTNMNSVAHNYGGDVNVKYEDEEWAFYYAPEELKRLQRLGKIKLVSYEYVNEVDQKTGGINSYYRYGYRDLTTDGGNSPVPEVKLTLKYAGNASKTVIVEAYQVNSAYPEYGEHMTARWSADVPFNGGVGRVTLIQAYLTEGKPKQGPAQFVAYIDADGDGRFSAGETFGTAEAEVGYLGCDIDIRLGDGNPALPTVSLVDSGTNETERPIQTVAIVRTKVNGQYVSPRGVMLKRYDNNLSRTAIYPSDWINETDGFIGVDKYLAFDAQDDVDPSDETLPAVEEVTYE
ncbi:MAG: hypothetical protein J6R63_03175, partial [Kiritimatiellae bacterium]|nr:hypothetical protein [Kiritimatiellia bacterium]